jgi:hypothetical protein
VTRAIHLIVRQLHGFVARSTDLIESIAAASGHSSVRSSSSTRTASKPRKGAAS